MNAGTVSRKYLILAFIILVVIFIVYVGQVEAGNGGSDENITVEANPGGSGDFGWNVTHGFVIKEHDSKVDEEFDIIICEEVKYNSSRKKHEPLGHIFGELYDIRWDDDPAPALRITGEDFQEYKHDQSNISVIVYGEYYNSALEKRRYAYFELTITRPNHAPVPVVRLSASDEWNWSLVNATIHGLFIVETAGPLQLWFNGSLSWDVDGDTIENWRWDLDGDGKFGYTYLERGMNVTSSYTHNRVFELGLMVIDERGKVSEIMNFSIEVILKTDTGGSDQHIKLSGIAGQTSGYAWNELHDFVIREHGERIDERFNVTICEDLQWNEGEWEISGHIFGKLWMTHWKDDPTPVIKISDEDFNTYGTDTFNITMYAHAYYQHPSEGYRYAYKRFFLRRPNLPPAAVAHLHEPLNNGWYNNGNDSWNSNWNNNGNDTIINLTQMYSYRRYVDPGESISLMFDATHSWDPDGDPIVHWMWALEDNGVCGEHADERLQVVVRNFSVGTYHLGLMVGDGHDLSPVLRFTIRIMKIPLRPNLALVNISVENEDPSKSHFDKGDHVLFLLDIVNSGRNHTEESFHVQIEYRMTHDSPYNYLGGTNIDPPLLPGDARNVTLRWDTSFHTYQVGEYELLVTVDSMGRIHEDNETDNIHSLIIHIEDRIAPVVVVTSPLNDTTVNGTITLAGMVSDNSGVVRFEYRLHEDSSWVSIDGNQSWSFQLNTTTIPDGKYNIEFRAWDGRQYSKIVGLYLRIRNNGVGTESEVPPFLIAFLISLVLITIAIIAFAKDRGGSVGGKPW